VSRIESRFAELRESNRKAFIAYITAGDPTLDDTVELAVELAEQGVDVLELGVPFSDPVADGPVNQEASMRALKNDVSVGRILGAVREIRKRSEIPIIFFAYYNTILAHGPARFVEDAAESGLDGALVLDLPPEEAAGYKELMDSRGLATVFLVSPITPEERIRMIARYATGFVYYVSRMGVTGERERIAEDIAEHVRVIRSHTDIPVVVGFGISGPEHVREAARFADGVGVGSSRVRRVKEYGGEPGFVGEVGRVVGTLTAALKGGQQG